MVIGSFVLSLTLVGLSIELYAVLSTPGVEKHQDILNSISDVSSFAYPFGLFIFSLGLLRFSGISGILPGRTST